MANFYGKYAGGLFGGGGGGGIVSINGDTTSAQLIVGTGNVSASTSAGTTTISLAALTAGSVVFSNGTVLSQDNSNFFWDSTNHFLGLGTAVPDQRLHLHSGSVNVSMHLTNSTTGIGGTVGFYLYTTGNDTFYQINNGANGRHLFLNENGGANYQLILNADASVQLPHYTTGIAHLGVTGVITSSAVSLTSDVSGILPIGSGGIGAATTAQNLAFIGPTSGSGSPTFRALVAGDIPSLSYVTSVALTVPAFLSVAGSPITSSGTLAVTLATQTANIVFAGPSSGGAVAPTFRALVAADIPSLSATYLPLAGGTMTGDINMGNKKLTAVNSVRLNNNAANKIEDDGFGGMGIFAAQGAEMILWVTQVSTTQTQGIQLSASGGSWGDSTLSAYPLTMQATTPVIQSVDNSTANASAANTLAIKASNKTAGTGDGGALTLSGGTSSGGTAGQVLIKTAGTTRIIADSNGRVAIGAQTPQNRLHLDNSGSSSISFQITNSTTGNSASTSGSQISMVGNELDINNQQNADTVFFNNGGSESGRFTAGHSFSVVGAAGFGYQKVAGATGGSTTVSDNISAFILTPAGTIATYTITMPANPFDSQRLKVCSSQIVTALTMSPNSGQTLDGSLASFAANGFGEWLYVTSTTTWYRVG